MDVLDYMARQFVAGVYEDFVEQPDADEGETKKEQEKLLDA